MTKKIQSIGVFTSGGDAPGMNAAVRAVVRSALRNNITIFGIKHGYEGMIDGEIYEMNGCDVANIIYRGGTILRTARSKRFLKPEGRKLAYANLKRFGIEGLVAIGGDGTFHGLRDMIKETQFKVIGLPGTIDNDLYGTDATIGYDTACNTAMYAIDKIKDTASSHERIFLVEVMGRYSGFIALETGIATGSEDILIPETPTDFKKLVKLLEERIKAGRKSAIVIVAEGDEMGGAYDAEREIKKLSNLKTKVAILGHIQRGGSPTMRDRVLATRLGFHSVEALIAGKSGVMAGLKNNKIAYTPIEETFEKKKNVSKDEIKMIPFLL
jgi:6-phosphofructokinase 1